MTEPGSVPDASFVERQARDVQRLLFIAGPANPTATTGGSAAEAFGVDDAPTHEDAGVTGVVVPPFRVVVATEFGSESFSATTVPLAVLTAFAQMFEAGAPVNLVFAVAHEAGDADVVGAQSLLGQLATTRALAGVAIESFAEAPALPAYVAVVPHGDPCALVEDLATAIVGMHLLAETLAHPGRRRIALVHQHLLSRRADTRLAERLSAYREVFLPHP